jgi:16S rRNA (guanine966-N2)-methyltransferase
MPVERFLARANRAYDLVMVDPPYADDVAPVLVALARLLAPDGLVVVEQSSRTDFEWPLGWAPLRHKAYGETTLWYGRLAEEVP